MPKESVKPETMTRAVYSCSEEREVAQAGSANQQIELSRQRPRRRESSPSSVSRSSLKIRENE